MIARDAIYDFIETLIEAAVEGDALHGAETFRNLRGSVESAAKIIRVECTSGEHNVAGVDGTAYREVNVEATVQCWVTPEGAGDDLCELEKAADVSFDMSQKIFDEMARDMNLGGKVCNCNFRQYETGEANLAGSLRGVTYLDGVVNAAQEG